MSLSVDDLFYVLINADIDTLTSVCLSQKNNPCTSFFWKLKFEQDALPILSNPTNFQDWRSHYIKVNNASIKTTEMLKHTVELNISSDILNYKKILSFRLRSLVYNFTPDYMKFNQLAISHLHDDLFKVKHIDLTNNSFSMNQKDIHELFTIIFYYHDIDYKIIK